MRLLIPLTGKVLGYDPVAARIDGIGVIGDPDDPVKPVKIYLGNVSSQLVTIDLENDLAEFEVSPGEHFCEPELDSGGNPVTNTDGSQVFRDRPATKEEKQGFLDYARHIIESKTKDELYAVSGSKRLVKPAGVVDVYIHYPPKLGLRFTE